MTNIYKYDREGEVINICIYDRERVRDDKYMHVSLYTWQT